MPAAIAVFSAARDCGKGRRTLRHAATGIVVDDVAIGAPLASELRAFGNVGTGVGGNKPKHQ
jgi:hypothetical protein